MPPTTAVIIPARGLSDLLDGCLAAVRAQESPVDEIVVVDDSPDGGLAALEGVQIVRSGGVGPYAARNTGWRSTGADIVLFADARSRPRPTWSRQLASHFDDPAVQLAGSDILITTGTSLAEQTAHLQQIFQLRNYTEGSAHLPYFPTCNLAVRRSALEQVGGFAEERSGADADLCWRVQTLPGAAVGISTEVLADWIPRDALVQYVEQFYRYGKSNVRLRREWSSAGVLPPSPASWRRLGARALRVTSRLARSTVAGDRQATLHHLASSTNLAYDLGQRRAMTRWPRRR